MTTVSAYNVGSVGYVIFGSSGKSELLEKAITIVLRDLKKNTNVTKERIKFWKKR